MKRMLYGALAVAGAAAALAVPSTAAAAAEPAGVACDKPAAECVRDVLFWLVTYDPCLTCNLDDEIRRACEIVFDTCS
jgi:hypothetical protein